MVVAVAELPVRSLSEELVEGRRRLDTEEASWLELLGTFEREEWWALDGYLTCVDWLVDRCRMGRSTGYEKLRIAAELRRRPALAEAFRAGELSYSHVRLITRISDPLGEIDAVLIDLAKEGSVRDLQRAIRHYELLVDQERPPGRDRDFERGSHTKVIGLGMKQARTSLPDAEMAEYESILKAFLDLSADGAGETVTWDGRRADAVMEMARTALAAAGKRAAGIDRYMTHVMIDVDTLIGDGPGVARLADGTPIEAGAARAMACDSGIVAHFVRNGYEPLDVGRRMQSFTVGQRRVIMARDNHTCRYPGCERTTVDCHHLAWFSNGGPTAVTNGMALCSRHHTRIHKRGFRIEGDDANGTLTFYRPDGTFVGFSAPPGTLPRL